MPNPLPVSRKAGSPSARILAAEFGSDRARNDRRSALKVRVALELIRKLVVDRPLPAGLGRSDGPDSAAHDARKKANLFLQTVSIVEAFLESVPQLALQVRAGVHGGELTEWVFVFSVSVSAFCIAKAIVVFVLNRRAIWETFQGLQGRVVEFATVLATGPPPLGEDRKWKVATAAEVTDNPLLLRRGGLGEWYIANLQDGMQVNGARRGYRVEPNNAVLRHTLYSRK